MKMFPGNQSEKPVIREIINSLKKRNNITGKTIQVADKGLNCSENIITALKNGDGYIFSKSVKQLPKKEKVWVLLDSGWVDVKDKNGKLLYKYKDCIDTFPYIYKDENGKEMQIAIKEKRVATFNPTLAEKQRYEINKMVEKARNLCLCKAKREEYGESSKYINFKSKDSDENAVVSINQNAIDKDLDLAGYNMIVTSELSKKAEEIYSIYHNLWRIEESFRIMKSDLNARPVFVQKENTIKGHFLVCYIAVLLERIFQFYILENKFSSGTIYDFFRTFEVVKGDHKTVNLTARTDFIDYLSELTDLPLNNYFLTETQLKQIRNWMPKNQN